MIRRLLVLTGIGICVAGWVAAGRSPQHRDTSAAIAPVVRPPYNPNAAQKAVAFHTGRVRRDPQGAIGWGMLAGAYLQRYRETGDLQDALRAEQAARKSLAIRTRYNEAALNQLALSLSAQHRFAEALAAVQRVLARDPENRQARLLASEIQVELGDYEAADRTQREGKPHREDIYEMALRARMMELSGQPLSALRLLCAAQAAANRNLDLPQENVAWFSLRVGDCLANQGRVEEAERAYREALRVFPRDYKAMTAMAKLAAGRGAWRDVLDWGKQAADIVPSPEVMGLLGDAYAARNKPKEAKRYYGLVETMGGLSRSQGVVYDRQRALFCADHDIHLDEALRLARRELKTRHDIYAYDTLAWVCFKKGRLQEADEAMRNALKRGAQDAKLFYHAGRIAYARGDRSRAKTYLARALACNPYFHPSAPQQARALLAKLDPVERS